MNIYNCPLCMEPLENGESMCPRCANNVVPEAAATREETVPAPARGWGALRADIERRLDEARREKDTAGGICRTDHAQGFYDGEIAALVYLLERDDQRKEAQPNVRISD